MGFYNSLTIEIKVITIAMLVVTSTYLGYLNFNLGFLNADEVELSSNLAGGFAECIRDAYGNGRASQIISCPIYYFIVPKVIEWHYLIPRYLTAIAFQMTTYLIFIKYVGPLSAIFLSSFVILSSQLDYSHGIVMFNGLFSYAGAFTLFFCSFIWSVVIERYFRSSNKYPKLNYAGATILSLASFGTESLAPCAFIYLISDWLINRRSLIYVACRPHALSLCIYSVLFFAMHLSVATPESEAVKDYLYGGIESSGFFRLIGAGLIFYIYSIPFYDLLGLPIETTLAISVFIIFLFCFAVYGLTERRDGKARGLSSHAEDIPLLISIFAFSVIVNMLIAARPDRLERALSLDWTRYIYSPYTWFAMVLISAAACDKLIINRISRSRGRTIVLVSTAVLTFSAACFAIMNIANVNKEINNISVWHGIARLSKNGKNDSAIHIDNESMAPSRLIGWEPGLGDFSLAKKYFKIQYSKDLLVCTSDILRQPGVAISNEGSVGGWTIGKKITIPLPSGVAMGDIIEIEVTNIFGAKNSDKPAIFRLNDDQYSDYVVTLSGPGFVRLPVSMNQPKTLVLNVPNPQSPKNLNMSRDERLLGYWIKSVRIKRGIRGFEEELKFEYCS